MMIYTAEIQTPLGAVTAAVKEEGIIGLWFVGQKYYPKDAGKWTEYPAHPLLLQVHVWLEGYFSGRGCPPLPPLSPQGTAFQKAVWDILQKIPYGRVTTYGQIAANLAADGQNPSYLARAVGGAVGHNPLSLLIPCHRVVGADGSLTGYAGGLDRKRALLKQEGALPVSLADIYRFEQDLLYDNES